MAKETRQDNLIQLVRLFESENPGRKYEIAEVLEWAIERGDWDKPSYDALLEEWKSSQCVTLAQAVRGERHRDRSGRSVRSFHSVTVQSDDGNGNKKQRGLWTSLENAAPEDLVLSVTQRYSQTQGDVVQLQNDIESINEFHLPKGYPKIQLSWDFTVLNNRY